MFTREFWLGDNGAVVRAVRTFGQTAAALIAVASFSPFDVGQWRNVAIVSGTAALVSLLMSLDRREALMSPSPTYPAALPPVPAPQQQPVDYFPVAVDDSHGYGESLR
jgi:hypothetical protein